ncbi:hypothetical protein [Qipengyuania gaetbuli]|uniref:hypothetical protein n=1 Tax=Qipengyuania gaetbuli TaxID=266952 RepID=UPI001CD53203|nr:hypothetical protein [Qipengyuania gaetbuli]MCA0909810.1 hypothetical protein [Qipengyuania gaetbuli]
MWAFLGKLLSIFVRQSAPRLSERSKVPFKLAENDAERLAAPFKMRAGQKAAPDPCGDIPEALLSADHIIEYVEKTGMIAPFDGENFRKSPLKAASYESKIGKCAYQFEKGKNYPTTIFDGTQQFLTVPANSIVFVESEIFFRLPPFIAVRFNLQINHVHRGLLLGTGPLVDPGFWGRLCIPLHNLTNEDYLIPKEDGLIWIEFTKTSSNPEHGRPPSNTEFPEIKDFILKAAKPQIPSDAQPISIRSSIPDMVEKADQKSQAAADSAKKSEQSAQTMRNYSVGGVIAGAIAVVTLAATVFGISIDYFTGNRSQIRELQGIVAENGEQFDDHVEAVDAFGGAELEARATTSALRAQIESQENEIETLRAEIDLLQSQVRRLAPSNPEGSENPN